MLNGHVSHWWQQAGLDARRAPLDGDTQVDVAIVGAGYTGLWTAYYLKRAAPDARVMVIDQRHVGYGASGRNGGWLTNSVTGGRAQYERGVGRASAEAMQLAMNQSVDEVIRVAAAERIDADIVRGGELVVAYTPAQEARMRAFAAEEQSWPHTDVTLLDAEEAHTRLRIPGLRAAVWHPHAARIQPAKLVRGLAHAAEALGVRIVEDTFVHEIRPHEAITDRGVVRADVIVRATEGFTSQLRGLRRQWLPMNSSLIVTEPLPVRTWEQIGWEGREVLGDAAHVYIYAQRTADDRIAFGGRGVPYRWGSRTDVDGQTAAGTADKLARTLHRLFPATRHAAIEHVWSGVLGVPRDWSATVGMDRATGLAWAGGYVGTGVTTTNLAGRTLADLIVGRETELTTLPWVNHHVRKWEPEPLRWIAARGLYAVYGWADRREEGRSSKTSTIAKLADVITGR